MHPSTHPPIILISSEVARSLHRRETFFLFPFSSTLCCISFLPSNFPVMKPSSRHQSFMPSYFIMYPNLSLFKKKKKKKKKNLPRKDAVCASMQQVARTSQLKFDARNAVRLTVVICITDQNLSIWPPNSTRWEVERSFLCLIIKS